VTEGCRKLYNEELHNMCESESIIWVIKLRIRWAGHVAHMGEVRNAYTILIGKSEGKK
jgi:hypothetical protein